MSGIGWSEDQWRTVTGTGNMIVSAAAGAGKTRVLTERLCRLVYQGTRVENLLVVTFTKAAATEMKNRIAKRLREFARGDVLEDLLETDPLTEEKKKYLRAQVDAVGGACICTNHAFCSRVLRRHGHLLEPALAPSFRIVDELETPALLERVRSDLFTGYGEEENADYLKLLKTFGSEDAVFDAVTRVDAFLASEADPEGWLSDAVERYSDPAEVEEYLADKVRGEKKTLRAALFKYAEGSGLLSLDWVKPQFIFDCEMKDGRELLELDGDFDQFRNRLISLKANRQRMMFPKGTPEEEKAPFQELRKAYNAAIDDAVKRFTRTAAEERGMLSVSGELLRSLARVVGDYRELFRAEKESMGAIDYNDLEHMALKLLKMPEVAKEYRERFAYIAVDEYQDSNRVQEAIINSIARGDNCFFVGDVKQSIYRFRLADPQLFTARCASFKNGNGQEIDLKFNYRSAKDVLDAVNDLFDVIMTPETSCGMIDYENGHRLDAGREETLDLSDTTELYVIGKKIPEDGAEPADEEETPAGSDAEEAEDGEKTPDEDPVEDLQDAEVEARLAARRIRELMDAKDVVFERNGRKREIGYHDFAILLRSRERADATARVLAQYGIPSYAQLGGGYFETIEVMLALNILRIIDNPLQDVPLVSVLYSVVGGFSATELADLRIRYRAPKPEAGQAPAEDCFYRTYQAACNDPEGSDIAKRCAAFHERVKTWRELAAGMPIGTLLSRILEDTGLYAEMGVLPGGAQRQANLDALVERAYAFEQGTDRGISAFLRFMDHAGKSDVNLGTSSAVGADVVRIMTIHKSKGLEFPVVLLMGLGKKFNLMDVSDNLCMHDTLGIGMRFTLDGVRHDTAARQAIAKRIREESLAEEMRVLYVAMTRAEQRLIMIGTKKNEDECVEPREKAPTAAEILKAPTMLDWLLMGKRDHVHVEAVPRKSLMEAVNVNELPAGSLTDAELEKRVEKLSEHLAWTYSGQTAQTVPGKVGVSTALHGRQPSGQPVEFEVPAFARPAAGDGRAAAPSATERGTAVHAVLEALPFAVQSEDRVRATALHLKEQGVLSESIYDVLPYDEIAWYTGTELFRRAAASARCERELSFSYRMDARKLYPDAADGEKTMLQGIIDCCFVEDGGWILVDYKTDRAREGVSTKEMAEEHRPQLDLYAEALTALTGLPVREKHVVLLSVERVEELK